MAFNFPKYPDNWDEIRRNVYKRDDYTCQRCGEKGGPYGNEVLNCAHIISKSKGGTDDYSNLETVCEECHIEEHPHMLNNPVIRKRHEKRKKNKGLMGIIKSLIA